MNASALPVTVVPIAALKNHPRNYKTHPEDQITHLAESIREHGLYRNIVVARDKTILAGHGVVAAARSLGMRDVPVVVLDLDPLAPRALKVLAGDNEVAHLGERDDRALSELLKEIHETDVMGLLGTGYDEMMLANLAMITRPAAEIADMDEAAAWVGLPGYESPDQKPFQIIITFRDEAARDAYAAQTSLRIDKKGATTWSTRWPWEDRHDTVSYRIEG